MSEDSDMVRDRLYTITQFRAGPLNWQSSGAARVSLEIDPARSPGDEERMLP